MDFTDSLTWEESSATLTGTELQIEKRLLQQLSNVRFATIKLLNTSRTIICSLELPRISWIEKKIISFSGIPEHFSEILVCSFLNVILENFQDFFEKFSTLVRFSVDLHRSSTAGR